MEMEGAVEVGGGAVDVGREGGGGAVVVPEGPGESKVARCCAPVTRNGGRGGETGKCDMCQLW